MDTTVLNTALVLGFLLGLKHATDADHVVAVSTIVSEYRNAWRGLWVGASWGLGHTTPLVVVGLVILVVRVPFPERLSLLLEFGVGIMLLFLGLQVFWNLSRRRLHLHEHLHESNPHRHLHSHEVTPEHEHHGFFNPGKPFFRLKSYLVGIVHGLAGSAAVMLLVLATIENFGAGLLYILVFGLGTILSMSLLTLIMGIPFSVSSRYTQINRAIQGVAGLASIVFGFFLMYEIAVKKGLFL